MELTYSQLLLEVKKNIRSRYVNFILDHFEWSYDDLLWFKETFPRLRKSNPLRKSKEKKQVNQNNLFVYNEG